MSAGPGIYPKILNALFGTRVRVIHGYGGTSALFLAMQRGEIQGSCAFQLSALKSAFRTSYEAGDLVPIVQFARKSPELKGVPHVLDFARTEQDRQVFNLVYNRDLDQRRLLLGKRLHQTFSADRIVGKIAQRIHCRQTHISVGIVIHGG